MERRQIDTDQTRIQVHHDLCCLVDDDARASLIFGAAVTLAVAAQSAVCHIDTSSHCLKITQRVAFEFLILAFSTNFCLIKKDLSGNTV